MTDTNLGRRFVTGGEDELEEIINLYGAKLLRYATAILCDYQEAENVVQDVFLSAYQCRAAFDGGNLSAWLYKITYNRSLNQLKKRKVFSFSEIRNRVVSPPDDTGLSDEILRALRRLKPKERALLYARIMEEWISNIGIVDGKLHVQTGMVFDKEFGSSDANLSLRTPDGELIECEYALMFFGDGDQRLLGKDDFDDAIYKYEESVFPVNSDELDGYTLCYSGSIRSGVEGHWKVAANLSDTSRQMRIWTNDIAVDSHIFEYLSLSPLGLEVRGNYEGKECLAGEMSLALETTDGLILLEGGGGSENSEKHTFNSSWETETPLDVAKVTAVMINGTRIPVK